ncbi:MAG: class E sortase [Actinobacteria bacterium]|nr:class E sortase [Actinomycetota bacterium]
MELGPSDADDGARLGDVRRFVYAGEAHERDQPPHPRPPVRIVVGDQEQRPKDPLTRAALALRQRAWARRLLSGLSVVMALVAVGVLGYPVYTNLYQDREQGRLTDQFATPELEQAYRAGNVAEGQSLTRLKIPSLKVDVVVVEGTTLSALRAGAGHYRDTPLPCEPGNVAIAGHRTTYGKPFSQIDLMKPGDIIILETPVGSCTYSVNKAPFIVEPTDFSVVAPTPTGTLTLTTCHPRNSAAQRLIVQADLQGPAAGA